MDDISESCPNLETFELYSAHMTYLDNIFIEDPEALEDEVTNKFHKLSNIAIAFKRGESSEDFGVQSYLLIKYLLAKCVSPDIKTVGLEKDRDQDLFVFKTTTKRSFKRYHDISSNESSEAEGSTKDLNDHIVSSGDEWTSDDSDSESTTDVD